MLSWVGFGAVVGLPGVACWLPEGLCGSATLARTDAERPSASVAAKLAVNRVSRSFTRSRISNLRAASLHVVTTAPKSKTDRAGVGVFRAWRRSSRGSPRRRRAAPLRVRVPRHQNRSLRLVATGRFPACFGRSVIRCGRLGLSGFEFLLQLGALLRSEHIVDLGHRAGVQLLHLCFLLVVRERGIVEDCLAL